MFTSIRTRILMLSFIALIGTPAILSAIRLTITNKSGVECRVKVQYERSSVASITLAPEESETWDSLPKDFQMNVWKCTWSHSRNTVYRHGRMHVSPIRLIDHPSVKISFRETTIDANYVIRLRDDSTLKLVSGEE